MKKFKFIGLGGAINVAQGGNSCFLKEKDNLFIIDVSEGATKKLLDVGAFEGINNIYIAITHTHCDHVAGLGVLIWYANAFLNIKPNIIYNDNGYKKHLHELLKVTGVEDKHYEFIHEKDLNFSFCVNMQPTTHAEYLQCFGIMFEDKDGKYYYTGDSNDYKYVRKLAKDDSVKTIYCEVATDTFDVHIKYDDIKDLDKDKLVLMHFNTVELCKRVKKDGFKVGTLAK